MADPTISSQNQTPREDAPASDATRRNPADNLTQRDRKRGGVRSAALQNRDQRGQFAGQKNRPPQHLGRERGEEGPGRSEGGAER